MNQDFKNIINKYLINVGNSEIGDFIVACIDACLSDNIKVLDFIKKNLDIETASGIWLDYLGWKIGYMRPYILNTDVPIFAYDINLYPPTTQKFGGYDEGVFIDLVASGQSIPLPDNLYRERIKLIAYINTHNINLNIILEQIELITQKVTSIMVLPGRVIVTFSEQLDTTERFLFESGYVIVAAGVLLTVIDTTGVIIGEPITGFGGYFADYIEATGSAGQVCFLT